MGEITLRGRLVLKEEFDEGYMTVGEFYVPSKAGYDYDDLLDILLRELGPTIFDGEVLITVRVLPSAGSGT